MSLIKRSFTLEGHKTSIALEVEFWEVLEKIAAKTQISMPHLISEIDSVRDLRPLASSLRVFCLKHCA